MRATKITGGLHDIDDSTTIDIPYRCKKCGKYIKIENRHHHWEHECKGHIE